MLLIKQSEAERYFKLIDIEEIKFKVNRNKIKNISLSASLPLIFKISDKRKIFFKTDDVIASLLKKVKKDEEEEKKFEDEAKRFEEKIEEDAKRFEEEFDRKYKKDLFFDFEERGFKFPESSKSRWT